MANTVETAAAAATARLDLTKMRKIALASVIGTTVEWYDLFVFGTASALVFNKIFFPSFDPLVGTMLAFGTFASATSPAWWAPSSSATSGTGWDASPCS